MKLAVSIVFLLAACGSGGGSGNGNDAGNDSGPGGDAGNGPGSDAGTDPDSSEIECGTLVGVIRDFKIDHPDFEVVPAAPAPVIQGLVNPTITPGGKPTLSQNANPAGLITSPASFAQWYTDVSGTNMHLEKDVVLVAQLDGSFVFDSDMYFPIDNEGFGNETNSHNYHFTTELHATFPYDGAERFTFRGDDDVWVFINGRLAIDIGGVHGASEATIDFDARATELGITKGNEYEIDFFQAERHVTGSNFRIETTIACFGTIF